MSYNAGYDNGFYTSIPKEDLLLFTLYNTTTRQLYMYFQILKQQDLFLAAKYEKLLVQKIVSRINMIAK